MKNLLLNIIMVIALLSGSLAGCAQDEAISIYKHQYNVGQKYIILFQNGRFCYIDIPKYVMDDDYLYKGQGRYCQKDSCVYFFDDGDAILSESNEYFCNDVDSISLFFYSFNDNEFECRNYFTHLIINKRDTFFFDFGSCQNLYYNNYVQTIDFFFPPHTWLRYDTPNPPKTNVIEFFFNYSFDYNKVYLEERNAVVKEFGEYLTLDNEKFVRIDKLPSLVEKLVNGIIESEKSKKL